MKLFYYKAPQGNIGDDLNGWLWPQILNDILDDNDEEIIVGVGTLLNHKLPEAKKYHILSTGLGYGEQPKTNIGDWNFIAVRGPLTAKELKLNDTVVLLDGAYLMPKYYQAEKKIKYKYSYIPHVDSMIDGHWEDVCELAGINLIDPRQSVESFINDLNATEFVITEAMHGAILADAYGIPWTPVKAYDYINEFKWNDWAKSLQLSIKFNLLPSIWRGDKGQGLKRKIINTIKRTCLSLGLQQEGWTKVLPFRSSIKQTKNTANQLKKIATSAYYQTSSREIMNEAVEKLEHAINNFINVTKPAKTDNNKE